MGRKALKAPVRFEASDPDAPEDDQIQEIADQAARQGYEWLVVAHDCGALTGTIHPTKENLVGDLESLKVLRSPPIAVFCRQIRLTEKEIRALTRRPRSPTPNRGHTVDHTAVDFTALKADVEADKKGWRDVLAILESPASKPWHTKEWKLRRKTLIGDRCLQCGSTTPPLVLQHTWQPTKLKDLFGEVRAEHDQGWQEWQREHPIASNEVALEPDANACPKCQSEKVFFQKTVGSWICRSTRNYVKCGHVFAEPLRVVSQDALSALNRDLYLKSRDQFDDASGVGKETVKRAIDQHLRYMSCTDVTTYCKRCAYRADKRGQVLCTVCRQRYHVAKYRCCWQCSQET